MCSSTLSRLSIWLKPVTLKAAAVRTSASWSRSMRTNVGSISSLMASSPTAETSSQKCSPTT
eukprot:428808-Pleurochrysis_carterae.AAC.1